MNINVNDIISINSSYMDLAGNYLKLEIYLSDQSTEIAFVPKNTTVQPWADLLVDIFDGKYGPINIYAYPVPQVVTMRQARLALLQENLLDQVQIAIDSLPDNERQEATINWEYSTVVERNSPWVINITTAMGLTSDQVDHLFRIAKTL